jgi:EF hand
MWRFLAGVASALLMMAAGILVWRSQADAVQTMADAPAATSDTLGIADIGPPLAATEKTREQKRFGRYDKDKNGAVSKEEYLLSRRKAYAKLDINGDGRLSFDEYVVKTALKFAKADRDRTGALTAAEFLATRVVRKTVQQRCPPPSRIQLPAAAAQGGDEEEG